MSKPVDVVAVLRHFAKTLEYPGRAEQAIDAVAELIEYAERFRVSCEEIKRDYPGDDPIPNNVFDLHLAIKVGMFAALAACKPAGGAP